MPCVLKHLWLQAPPTGTFPTSLHPPQTQSVRFRHFSTSSAVVHLCSCAHPLPHVVTSQTTRRRLKAKRLKRRREGGGSDDDDEDEGDATPPRKRKKEKVCIYDVIAVSLHYYGVIMMLVSECDVILVLL